MEPLHRLLAAAPASRFHLWRNTLAASLLLIASVASAATEYPAGDLAVEDYMPLGSPAKSRTFLDTVEYSNVTNFLGQGFVNGGTALQGTNLITRIVMDDILPTGANAGQDVTQIKFSVANLNAVTVSARARVRVWFDNAGVPGAYYTVPSNVGFSFNALAFGPGVTVVTGSLGPALFAMPDASAPFWAGITFDNNNGATGATLAQMDLMGQGIFDPADVGFSDDIGFQTTAAGSFFTVANPVGTLFNFAGVPPVNFGWEFTSVTATPTTQSSWGRIKNLYK